MRVITVSKEEEVLYKLLTSALNEDVILQTTDGLRFVLLAVEGWEGFEVGDRDDFEQEVELTVQNQELMAFLAARRTQGKRVPLAEVKKQLGLY